MNKNARILIVDDDKSILMLLKHSLETRFQVTACSAPADALEYLKDTPFDVVITDFSMPYMDGITLLTNAENAQPQCARVLLTGEADLDTAQRAVNEGHVSAFMTKPWQHKNLMSTICGLASEVKKNKSEARQLEHITLNQKKLKISIQKQQQQIRSAQAEAKKQIKKQQALYQSTITLIHQLIEFRFADKKAHYERISKLAMRFAAVYGLESKQTTTLYLASLMYDIGLLAMETSDAQQAHRQNEPALFGSQLVSSIPGLTEVANTIEGLNENMNGSGSPHRLSSEEIPLLSRILRVIRDFDLLQESNTIQGNRRKFALLQLHQKANIDYDATIVSQFEAFIENNLYDHDSNACLSADELHEGQVVQQAIVGTNSAVLLKSGMTLTAPLISRLKRYEVEHNMRLAVFT